MSKTFETFNSVLSAVSEDLEKLGFEKVQDENGKHVTEAEGTVAALYKSEKGCLKAEYNGDIMALYAGADEESATTRLTASLLADNADVRDIKYVATEIKETLNEKFGVKNPTVYKKQQQKTPQTVSKNAVKHGSFYDANTLASRLCLVFPELRPEYKENLEKYGEFMGEEFFSKYGTKKVIEAIKQNDPQTMKKMFQILNEIYEDGTTAVQGLIAVTILGELNNDQILLARCVDYMSETMAPPVIEVNKFLASGAGKKARAKMANPPAYKPKKEKKPGFFQQMMAQGGGQPPVM